MKALSILGIIAAGLVIIACAGRNQIQSPNHTHGFQVSTDLEYVYDSLAQRYDLKYGSYKQAVEAFKKALRMDVEPSEISFYVPGKIPREDGKPYFILNATTSFGKSSTRINYCQKGWFSLADDNFKFWEDYCGPIN